MKWIGIAFLCAAQRPSLTVRSEPFVSAAAEARRVAAGILVAARRLLYRGRE